MLLIKSLVLLICISLSSAARIGIKAHRDEPLFCKQQVPEECKNNQIMVKRCPHTCGDVAREAEQQANTTVTNGVIAMEAVSEKMRTLHLNQVRRSDLYEQAWPENCDAQNKFGTIVQNLNTDRFLCDSKTGAVPSIVTPGWLANWKNFICCKGTCEEQVKCGLKPYTFAEAARNALSRAALDATHVMTPGGRKVQVDVEEADSEEFSATGVFATVEVRMFESDLKFNVASPEFADKSIAFFDDLVQSLGPLISMQISAFDVPVKTVVCAHSETTRTEDQLNQVSQHESMKHLFQLPVKRARTLRARLEQFVPTDTAEIGEPIGHYQGEVPEYVGGRRAFIIYKIHDKRMAPPECKSDDLHRFLAKYNDRNE